MHVGQYFFVNNSCLFDMLEELVGALVVYHVFFGWMFAALSQSISDLYALLISPDDLFFIGYTEIAFES